MSNAKSPIRVLHLADLFVEEGESVKDPNSKLRKYHDMLVKSARATIGDSGRFDYVVVCGNLTRNGSMKEFNVASAFLKSLHQEIGSLGKSWQAQTILVPGPSDGNRPNTNSPINLKNYNTFYKDNDFHDQEYEHNYDPPPVWHHPRGEKFQMSVRVHDEFTSVGFFWDRHFGLQDADRWLWEMILQQHGSWSCHKGLVLVSSCVPSPMAAMDYLRPYSRELVHLVGRTTRAMIEEVRYNALRWNVDFQPKDRRNNHANIHSFSDTAGQCEHRGQTFEIVDRTPLKLEYPIPPKAEIGGAVTRDDVFAPLLQHLWDRFTRNSDRVSRDPVLLIVRGFPGGGKTRFFNRLMRSRGPAFATALPDPDRTTYLLESVQFWNDGGNDLRCVSEKLHHAARLLQNRSGRHPNAKSIKGIVVVYDQSTTEGLDECILNFIRTNSRIKYSLTDLHIVYMWSQETKLQDYLQGEWNQKRIEEYSELPNLTQFWLPFLKPEHANRLRQEFRDVAWEQNDVAVLAGDWIGLRLRLLESLRAHREDVQEAKTRKRRWAQLLEYGEIDNSVHDELKFFLDRITNREKPAIDTPSNPVSVTDRPTVKTYSSQYPDFNQWVERWAPPLRGESAVLPLSADSNWPEIRDRPTPQ